MTALRKAHDRYPMRVVAKMTGLTPDTIRAWERRYEAVTPDRTDGGARRYNARHVRRLVLLRDATRAGHTISTIADLSDQDLSELVDSTPAQLMASGSTRATWQDEVVEVYLSRVLRFETRAASELLGRAATLMGPRRFSLDVALPIISEVGRRWSHSELGVAQEHLASAQLRGTLSSLLSLTSGDRGAPRLIVTTPPGHRHEFGVLAGSLLAASRGFDVTYLGPDLPASELLWAASMSSADLMLLGVARDVTDDEVASLQALLPSLREHLDVWIGAPEHHPMASIEGLRAFHDYDTFDLALAERVS